MMQYRISSKLKETRSFFSVVKNHLFKRSSTFHDFYFENPKTEPLAYNKLKLESADANRIIGDYLKSDKPFLITRLGSGEIRCVSNYWHNKTYNEKVWHDQVKFEMFNFGGVFPQTSKALKKFAIEYISHFDNIDLIGIWYNRGEEIVCNQYAPEAKLVDLVDLEPYYHIEPWSQFLEGKKVLLIHPFDKSIKNQYKKRKYLFKNKLVLPDFELDTFKTFQSFPGHTLKYKSWNHALSIMKNEISKKEFQIAIIGAGPYGLPLASHVKNLGKQALHLGGATQLLFGIKGGRWDTIPFITSLYNKYWARPLPEETPVHANKVENKAYW